jgi:Xaa-Pro aminopeptidase
MAKLGAERHFISTLDDIAYLFNLRGADVSFNPVFVAHALVEPSARRCSSPTARSMRALRARLEQDGVRVAPYDQAPSAGRAAADSSAADRSAPHHGRHARRRAAGVRVVEAINPTTFAKSRKLPAPRPTTCATRWSRTAPRCANSSPGSNRRWPTRSARR